jgi:hypothetical protein
MRVRNGRLRREVRLDPGIEIDEDELEGVMNGDAQARTRRARVITLPPVAWLQRDEIPMTRREQYGRP